MSILQAQPPRWEGWSKNGYENGNGTIDIAKEGENPKDDQVIKAQLKELFIDPDFLNRHLPDDSIDYSGQKYKFANPTLIIFENKETKQIIKYYISTNIKYNMNELLKKDISESTGLIVQGYIPIIYYILWFWWFSL